MPNLTLEQQNVVRCIMKDVKSSKQIITFSGLAGTGKTTCISLLAKVLKNFAVAAYTGKAASILRKKGISKASTIHSLIYRPETWGGKTIFVLVPPQELYYDGFIIDEASLVSKEIYDDLLTFNKPIIFVGDHGQLEPIGSDINLMADPMYRLETIHRNAGEIAHFANHLRQGKSARSFESSGKVEIITPGSVTDEQLVGVDQIICAFNKFRVGTNKLVRDILGYTDLLVPNERVMCLRNNKNAMLFNGMQGVVKSVDLDHYRMDFVWDEVLYKDIWFDGSQFHKEKPDFAWGKNTPHPFEYAYAITAHKCVKFDTYLFTKKGMVQIQDLWTEETEGRLCDLDLAMNTKNGIYNAKQIFKGNVEESYKITDSSGREIVGSYRHPILVLDENGDFVWKLCKNIKISDVLVSKLNNSVFNDEHISIEYTPSCRSCNRAMHNIIVPNFINCNHGLLFGYLVGDGSYANDHCIEMASQDDEILDNCIRFIADFGIKAKIYKSHSNARRLNVWSIRLREFLLACGLHYVKAHDKEVPHCILASPKDVQVSFLQGLFDTDGSVNQHGVIRLVSVSEKLIRQVQLMLFNIGIVGRLKFNVNKYKGFYVLGIYARHSIMFAKCINFGLSYKKKILAEYIESGKFFGKTNIDLIPFAGKQVEYLKQEICNKLGSTQGKKGQGFYNNLSKESKAVYARGKKKPSNLSCINLRTILNDIAKNWPFATCFDSFIKLNMMCDYFYTKVTKIEQEYCQVYDLSVPDALNFVTNGFISKNSQGDQWDKVMVYEQKCDKWCHKRWSYTAASRAKEHVTYVCPNRYR